MGKPKPVKPPDPQMVAQAQTGSNVDTAVANQRLNATNQYTPYGSLTYSDPGTAYLAAHPDVARSGMDPWSHYQQYGQAEGRQWTGAPPTMTGGRPVYQSTARVALSPQEQAIYDAESQSQAGMARLASDYMGRIGAATAQPFSTAGMPAGGTYNAAWGAGFEAPRYDEAFRQQQLGRIVERAQPQMDEQRRAMEQTLANQGITLGSEAWRNAQGDYSRGVSDFRLGADIQAGQEAERIFGLQGMARDRAQQEEAFRIGQMNTGRDRAIAEALMIRNQPLNEVTALLHGGGGVQMPQFVNTPSSTIANTGVAGIYAQDMQARLANAQMKQSGINALIGGVSGLAGAGIGGWARGGFGAGTR